MSKACPTCGGRGRWQERDVDTSGEALIWHECNDCNGTGLRQDGEAGDDFDIGGDSYADDD